MQASWKDYVRGAADLIDRKRHVRVGIRNLVHRWQYRGHAVRDAASGNRLIIEGINGDRAFSAGKMGSVELSLVDVFQRAGPGREYPAQVRSEIFVNAGVFPRESAYLDMFAATYVDALAAMDVLAAWNGSAEVRAVDEYSPDALLVHLRAFDPYYFELPWSSALAGKRVAVITPFAETFAAQYDRRHLLWPNRPEILPAFEPRFIRSFPSPALVPPIHASWHDNLSATIGELDSRDYDVLLVGAGAYSLPLCAHAKASGKKSVHMGGALQVLFGVKGARYDRHPIIASYYNEHWVRPAPSETPKNVQLVENGCYW